VITRGGAFGSCRLPSNGAARPTDPKRGEHEQHDERDRRARDERFLFVRVHGAKIAERADSPKRFDARVPRAYAPRTKWTRSPHARSSRSPTRAHAAREHRAVRLLLLSIAGPAARPPAVVARQQEPSARRGTVLGAVRGLALHQRG
jgi:hypothetical protein